MQMPLHQPDLGLRHKVIAMVSNSFDSQNRFNLPGYTSLPPFSSFLPGIAGQLGVPMWVFYVNRGQAITSFGVESKDHPIMEFQSANKAYQRTPYEGFRTFIRWTRGEKGGYYEPFWPLNSQKGSQQKMSIGMSELEISDENPALGLNTQVVYFTLPGESFAALARQVTFTNTGDTALDFEVLDGMPAIIPYGVDNEGLKAIGRTLEAWMQVSELESGLPFFRLGATPGDSAEVHEIQAGHFALGFASSHGETVPLAPFVDPAVVFGPKTSFSAPDSFIQGSLDALRTAKQITVGKTPCAFFGHQASLAPGESTTLDTLFGHVNGYENIAQDRQRLASRAYFSQKRAENRNLVRSLTEVVATKTSEPLFDAYARQTFLDNVLRGGWPVMLGDAQNPYPYHIFSRKHGDPERDYNYFFLSPEFFSQGNGNFRDVCQNRRSDVLLEPRVGEHNIRTFLSLIQLDGYNPLVILGTSFTLSSEQQAKLLELTDSRAELAAVLEGHFTPGELLKYIVDRHIELHVSYSEFIQQVLTGAQANLEAAYGEGFWVDHWTYILDLIENFLAVYPDRKKELLHGPAGIPFYQSPAQVRPRSQRYVLTNRGARQYDAVAHDGSAGWRRTPAGEIAYTTVFGKLMLLAGIKFGTLDPQGMGIEMEAGKPGWYDALNGLPGIFGSSMPETYELLRLIRFLRVSLAELDGDPQIRLPVEFADYLIALVELSQQNPAPFAWWEAANDLREAYREKIYRQISGAERTLLSSRLDGMLDTFERHIRAGIERAQSLAGNDVPHTYFRYEVTRHELLVDEADKQPLNEQARPHIQAKSFQQIPLPPFLEGAVRAMKVAGGEKQARSIHTAVQNSALYDPALKMYKVNAPLADQPHEIGRARAFTPGWLENESIWLHMEYKYLLEMLKAGLYEEFFDDLKNCLIPFQPPERYGRSPLENSSFLVSSAHPDKSLHGGGFVARLSGATAEFIEMWTLMMAGKAPFQMQNGELILSLRPILPDWLFDEQNLVQFRFLGCIPVRYHNPRRVDTWKQAPEKITLQLKNGENLDFDSADIPAPYAQIVRRGDVKSIVVNFD
jgi:hypothetical protein